MLTDKDKWELFQFTIEAITFAKDPDNCREEIVVNSCEMTLRFITAHPDLCAAEIDEFFLYYKHSGEEEMYEEFMRLKTIFR